MLKKIPIGNMKHLFFLIPLTALLIASGCSSQRIALTYQTHSAGIMTSNPIISVGQFADDRRSTPDYLGRNRIGKLHSTEPVSLTVANAFTAGLQDRGLLASGYQPRYILTGKIKHFSASTQIRRDANMVIEITLTTDTGRPFYVHTFKQRKVESYAFARDSGLHGNQEKNATRTQDLGSRTLTNLVNQVLDAIENQRVDL